MAKYKIEFWFDYGGGCLWAVNEAARNKYGAVIDERELPISGKLKNLIRFIMAYYDERLDWDEAPNISPWWTREDDVMFIKKAKFAYERLREELGSDYEIVYRVE